ncbi:cation diffusion facilitator family transporter [Niabella drilacis]|uniref:Cation diffusion facilitator family transporter n=1 Tax=Niabella drilacis (strain DSM 25811 / CCM 8410 / CCUG 62505 / LMG 26954 / E90) TaxID=1285928 RepID=A0A1G6QCV5_NIADE|nr:cation diffusion facilitator family transporter [Niabella drilacis]SDC90021.1 cation diffusion facilitator family transporter [Niabella drilacis]
MAAKGSRQNLKIQKWVAAISLLLLIVKFIAYFFTHSVAILTDALESIANVAAGFIGLYSLFLAAQPRDANHPYGHGKAEFLSAAIEGTLIGIAGLVVLYKAIDQLIHPMVLAQLDLGMILISATAVVNYALGSICIAAGKKNHSIALEVSGRHLRTDTYSTIAVIAGLALVFFTKIHWLDSVIAILLTCLLLYTSYSILRRSIAGIMDEADQQLLQEMITYINKNRMENWVDLHNFRVIKYGSVLHIDCHLTVPWYLNVIEAHSEIDQLAALIRDQYGQSVEFFVHSDGCRPFQCVLCSKTDCPVRQSAFEKTIPWTLKNVLQNQRHRLSGTAS